jgi:magnesium transporter
MDSLERAAVAGDMRSLQQGLAGRPVADVVRHLRRLPRIPRALAFRTLDKGRATEVFEDFGPALQRELIEDLREDGVRALFDDLDPDVRVEVLQEVPPRIAQRLLSGLSGTERAATMALLGWPAESVGRRMTPEVIALPDTVTAGEALAEVRRQEPQVETVYTLAVVGPGRRLVGVVSLRRLLVAPPDSPITDLLAAPVSLPATAAAEEGARELVAHGFGALPVVDLEGRLLGLFTADDAYRILERETDEDLSRAGGSEPLGRPYLLTSIGTLYRRRIVWLLVLLVAATLTVSVLDFFEAALQEVVALALFIPLLIGTAGNTGSQAATTCVRSMAVGDVAYRDLARVAGKEFLTGALLGVTMGAVAFVPAAVAAGTEVATVVGTTLVVICTMAATVGVVVPMVARRAGLDPAVVSAPFIATFTDAVGLVVYFLIATAILGLG